MATDSSAQWQLPNVTWGGGAGDEGIPSYDSRLGRLSAAFTTAFERATPDFQSKNGYGVDPPGQADLTIASNAVRFSAGLHSNCSQHFYHPSFDF